MVRTCACFAKPVQEPALLVLSYAMDRSFGRCTLYCALLIHPVRRHCVGHYWMVEGFELVCCHISEVASLKRILYLCWPTKNVISLVGTWVAPIGGLWGVENYRPAAIAVRTSLGYSNLLDFRPAGIVFWMPCCAMLPCH